MFKRFLSLFAIVCILSGLPFPASSSRTVNAAGTDYPTVEFIPADNTFTYPSQGNLDLVRNIFKTRVIRWNGLTFYALRYARNEMKLPIVAYNSKNEAVYTLTINGWRYGAFIGIDNEGKKIITRAQNYNGFSTMEIPWSELNVDQYGVKLSVPPDISNPPKLDIDWWKMQNMPPDIEESFDCLRQCIKYNGHTFLAFNYVNKNSIEIVEYDESKNIVKSWEEAGISDFKCFTINRGRNTVTMTGTNESSIEVPLSKFGVVTQIPVQKLDVLYASRFKMVWCDYGSSEGTGGSFFKPVVPEGYCALGYYGRQGYDLPDGRVLVVREAEGIVKRPVTYERIWYTGDSYKGQKCFFWKPVPPDGYAAMGMVVTNTAEMPSLNEVACINKEYVSRSSAYGSYLWNAADSFQDSFTVWRIEPQGVNEQQLQSGTFYGTASSSQLIQNDLQWCIVKDFANEQGEDPGAETGEWIKAQGTGQFHAYKKGNSYTLTYNNAGSLPGADSDITWKFSTNASESFIMNMDWIFDFTRDENSNSRFELTFFVEGNDGIIATVNLCSGESSGRCKYYEIMKGVRINSGNTYGFILRDTASPAKASAGKIQFSIDKQNIPTPPDAPCEEENPVAVSPVILYENDNYQGRKAKLHDVGKYDSAELDSYGLNDSISSIQIPEGCTVTVYWDAHYSGASTTFNHNVTCRDLGSFNDKISSFVIRNDSPYWHPGVGQRPAGLSDKALEVINANQFSLVWNDKGSGGHNDGAYYKPEVSNGYYAVGYYGQSGYGTPFGPVLAVKPYQKGVCDFPVDYERVWTDRGSGASLNGAFWKPIPPDGYVALGMVVTDGKWPSREAVVCIKSEYTKQAKAGNFVWDDSGTGSNANFGSWLIEPAGDCLSSGTFFGVTSHQRPVNHDLLHCITCSSVNLVLESSSKYGILDDNTKYEILKKYAPRVWLSRRNYEGQELEPYKPSSVEWAFNYLERYQDSQGRYCLKTKDTIGDHGKGLLPLFFGNSYLNTVPVYAYWRQKQSDDTIDLVYFFYYPYNRGKWVFFNNMLFGNHVSDWEHITVRIKKCKGNDNSNYLEPRNIYISAHDFGGVYTWREISKVNNSHPVVYSAWGSHGLWKDPGNHVYKETIVGDLVDDCNEGLAWDTWNNVIGFDYKNMSGLHGTSWPQWMKTEYKNAGTGDPKNPASGPVYRWGNPAENSFFGYYVLDEGPTGPSDKDALTNDTDLN